MHPRQTSRSRTHKVVERAHVAILAFALLLAAGCFQRRVVKTAPPNGSCEGACAHYLGCKRSRDPERRRACIRECLATFSTDGVQDVETLGHLQSLNCEKTISFIEGDTGRGPGEEPPSRGAPASDSR